MQAASDYMKSYTGRTVVVTGGAGAIGSNLTRALAGAGDLEDAEVAYWDFVSRGPVTVPLLTDFLDNHEHLKIFEHLPEDATRSLKMRRQRTRVADEDIERVLAQSPARSPSSPISGGTFASATWARS